MTATPTSNRSIHASGTAAFDDPFRPPWMLRNGHVQTLVGTYLFGRAPGQPDLTDVVSTRGEVELNDGDRLVFHDESPAGWQPGQLVALLLHGLAGSHLSPYMARVAEKLNRRGVRTFRLNWRGCGTGAALARYPYHSGRSDDVVATLAEIQTRCPNSPVGLIGFSMGGNIGLKLLGETRQSPADTASIVRAVAVCPPVDLLTTVESLRFGLASWYDAYFARCCIRNIRQRQEMRPDAIVPDGWFSRLPRTMREFDETFTAPICGFASEVDYYNRSSANQFLATINVPTMIIAAQDDPVVPYFPLAKSDKSSAVQVVAPRHGGHVGFVTTKGPGWLDQQIIDWIMRQD